MSDSKNIELDVLNEFLPSLLPDATPWPDSKIWTRKIRQDPDMAARRVPLSVGKKLEAMFPTDSMTIRIQHDEEAGLSVVWDTADWLESNQWRQITEEKTAHEKLVLWATKSRTERLSNIAKRIQMYLDKRTSMHVMMSVIEGMFATGEDSGRRQLQAVYEESTGQTFYIPPSEEERAAKPQLHIETNERQQSTTAGTASEFRFEINPPT